MAEIPRDQGGRDGGSSAFQVLTLKKDEKFSVTQNLIAALGEELGVLVLNVPQPCALGLRIIPRQLG